MVEETETPKVLEELAQKNTAPARKRIDSRKRNAIRRMMLFLFILLPLLAGLTFLGYQQWSLRLTLNRMAQENGNLRETISGNNTRIAELESTAATPVVLPTVDEADIEALRAELNSRIQRLNSQLTELQQRSGVEAPVQDGRWRIAEAEHLLRLANQQLQLSEDIPSTISLLQSADDLLVESEDTRVVQARQTLLREIGQLRALEATDLEGLYLRLGNLRDEIAGIEIAGSVQEAYRQRLAEQADSEAQPAASASGSFIDSSMAFLGSVFVWREWEDRPEVMQPPQELLTIKQNLNLMLEQAQLAVMMRRPRIYQESLARARDWIANYLTGVSDAAPGLLTEVDALLAERLSPELPDISGSLRQLRQIRASNSDAVAGNL